MNEAVSVCQSDYIAADDLGGKQITLKIARLTPLPKEDDRGKKKSKDVVLWFEKARKPMRLNPTNQWSIALLLGTKKASEWIGKSVSLTTDTDINIESGEEAPCLRLAGSPDAQPANASAFIRAWNGGPRKRGKLASRLKLEFRRLVVGAATNEDAEEPTADELPPEATAAETAAE